MSSNQGSAIFSYHRDGQPPDGGYGWVCAFCCFLVNCFTWGITASYGVYLSNYLNSNSFPEANARDFAFIGSFNFSVAMIASPLVTVLTRQYGKHSTMGLGIVFQATGFGIASISKHIWQLYVSQGVLVGLGTGFLYIPSTAILSQWFSKKRSLANGISAAGSGVGGAIFTWVTGSVIENLSVAWSLRITCFIALIANTSATLLIRDRNQYVRPPQLALDTRLLRQRNFCLLLSWAFISMLGYITLLYSLGDFGRSIGFSQSQSTSIIGLLNVGTAIGRPLIGVWSDSARRLDVAAILTLLTGVFCLALWVPATGFELVSFFALLVGAIFGVFWMVAGLKNLQSSLSISWLVIALPTMFSEVIALQLRRPTKVLPYLYAQVFAGVMYIVAGALITVLAVVKRGEEESESMADEVDRPE
ncbi:MFS general substrate transporter [Myriangium duriaei CBS 260.36]|uniref:MFS general substrate transporter n=1 Tax=Myriangium duriaei CBS 260.36 TaxID=1168546 RepID=A0A9P4IZH1_9PEZI|nr:MFS general substrate transporter [Myriangium duriaei CBS 260.36]